MEFNYYIHVDPVGTKIIAHGKYENAQHREKVLKTVKKKDTIQEFSRKERYDVMLAHWRPDKLRYIENGDRVFASGVYLIRDMDNTNNWMVDKFIGEAHWEGQLVKNIDSKPYVVVKDIDPPQKMAIDPPQKMAIDPTLKDEYSYSENYHIDCILCGALEGGSNYWIEKVSAVNNDYKGKEFASEVISAGGKLLIKTMDDEEPLELTRTKMSAAIKKYCKEHDMTPDELLHYGDAGTDDNVLQLALFGELVYS